MAMPDKVCGVQSVDVSQSQVYACDFPLELTHSLICTFVNVYCSSMQKNDIPQQHEVAHTHRNAQVWGRVQEVHGDLR